MNKEQFGIKLESAYKRYLKDNDMKPDGFCKLLNVKYMTLYGWLKGTYVPNIAYIKLLENILDIDLSELYSHLEDENILFICKRLQSNLTTAKLAVLLSTSQTKITLLENTKYSKYSNAQKELYNGFINLTI